MDKAELMSAYEVYESLFRCSETLPIPNCSAFSAVMYNKASGQTKLSMGRESVIIPSPEVLESIIDFLTVARREIEEYRQMSEEERLLGQFVEGNR